MFSSVRRCPHAGLGLSRNGLSPSFDEGVRVLGQSRRDTWRWQFLWLATCRLKQAESVCGRMGSSCVQNSVLQYIMLQPCSAKTDHC